MTEQPKREIDALTSLRMVAALLVFLFHFQSLAIIRAHPDENYTLLESVVLVGFIGVTMFFVLSGFLITLRYYDRFRDGQVDLWDYVRKRIARIWPLYYVVLALTLALNQRPLFSPETIPNWTITQGFFADYGNSGIPTAWSLTVEELFYLVAPLIYLVTHSILQRRRVAKIPRLVSIAVILVGWAVGLYIVGRIIVSLAFRSGIADAFGGFMENAAQMETMTLFGTFYAFAFGIGAAFIYRSGRVTALWNRPNGKWISDGLSVIALLGIGLSCQGIERNLGSSYYTAYAYYHGVAAATALWIIALTCPDAFIARFMSWRPFVYLGRASYALYLIQLTPVGVFPFMWLDSSSVLYVPLLYLGMNGISAILYEMVEKPMRRVVLHYTDRTPRAEPQIATQPGSD